MSNLLAKIKNLIDTNNLQEAESLAWQYLSQNKKNVVAMKTLGVALLMQRKYRGALDVYLKAYELSKHDFDILNNIAHLSLQIEEFQKAEEFAKLANLIKPEAYQPYVTIADVLLRKRDFEGSYEAISEMQKRVTFESLITNHQTLYLMLDIFVACNKEEEAMKFINFSYTKKFVPEIFYYHAGMDAKSISKNLIQLANHVLKNAKFQNHIIKAKTLGPIYFGLGRAYLGKDQVLSDINFIQGNSEVSDLQRFRPLDSQVFVKNIKKVFDSSLYEPQSYEGDGSNLIFIAGMPRSGTTLLESIISSSGEVFSCGELTGINDIFGKYHEVERNNELDEKILGEEDEGSIYLRRVTFLNSLENKKFILDKLPANFYFFGYIKKRFPKAKIFYIKRNPWDNAISLFQQFYVANIPYSSTFFNIAVAYANHEEMVRYWKEDQKIDFMSVNYEDLVSHTEEISNQVFHYCGIQKKYDGESRKGFFSRTASKNQVRADIHKKSIKKQAFEQQKDEFLECLANQRSYWKNN